VRSESAATQHIGGLAVLAIELFLWVNSRQSVFAGKLDDPLSFAEKGVTSGGHYRAHPDRMGRAESACDRLSAVAALHRFLLAKFLPTQRR